MIRRANGQVSSLGTGAVGAVVQDGSEEVFEREGGVVQCGDADIVSDEGESEDGASWS